jgi:hypothetical protein
MSVALRAAIVAACLYGSWWCWRLARADYLFRQDTPRSVRAAIRLVPSEPKYYLRLAQLDGGRARELLETALRLNRYDAQAAVELGIRYEADGDYARAEKLLLQAWAVDHTYLPRWSLANYYLRRDNLPAFWFWARNAAEMPAADISSLFQLCWRVTPDAANIAKEILPNEPDTIRQYLGFLLGRDQVRAVVTVAPRLVRYGNVETDRSLLLSVVNRLIASSDEAAATALWHLLVEQRWVVADTTAPNNATFSRDPLPVAFDWSLPAYDGLHSWPGSSGLEAEFSGRQPESCVIAEQVVALAPGNYRFRYSYRTSNISPDTGIEWRILDAKAGAVLAVSPDLSSETLKQPSVNFVVPPGISLVRLRLAYNRALGTPRVSGMLVLISTSIVAEASHDLSSVQ